MVVESLHIIVQKYILGQCFSLRLVLTLLLLFIKFQARVLIIEEQSLGYQSESNQNAKKPVMNIGTEGTGARATPYFSQSTCFCL